METFKEENYVTIIPSKREVTTSSKKKVTVVEEAFETALTNCEQLLHDVCEDIFDLLDPVISDSQCHIHSVFIISRLLQAYDKNGIVPYNFKRLSIEDRKLLSHVVLLSLLKYEVHDQVGFVVYSQLIDNLGIFAGKPTSEKKFIGNLKVTFNACSIEYMKRIATGNIKKIFDGCNATLNRTKIQLQLLPCYVTFHALLKYMEENKLPIVILLVRFNVESQESVSRLKISSKSLLFYEYQKDKKSFVFKHKKLLNEDEKLQPTITFPCYSVINKTYPEYFEEYMEGAEVPSDRFLTEQCDIRDLIMVSSAGHIQLTCNDPANEGDNIEEYIRQLYKQNSNLADESGRCIFKGNFDRVEKSVFGCYEFHNEISKKFGIAGSRYAFKTRFIDQSHSMESTHLVFRRCENTFFQLDHVKISTYSRESNLFKSFVVNSQVPLVEPANFNNSIAKIFLESKLVKLALHKKQ